MGSHACFEARTKKKITSPEKNIQKVLTNIEKKYLYIFIYIITIPGNGRQVCTKKQSLEVEKKEQHKTQANKPMEKFSRTRNAEPDVQRATSP